MEGKLFQIALDGSVRPYAGGNAAGSQDGDLSEVTFNFPNGIALSPTGDSLIIAQSATSGLLRLIIPYYKDNLIYRRNNEAKTEKRSPNLTE